MRHFKPSLTLRLPVDLLPRLNAQAELFPFTNPHALGLHFLITGLEQQENLGFQTRDVKTIKPARPARKGGKP